VKYLVTGGAGFIGSHLAERLVAHGHDVIALDNVSTGRLENLKHASQSPAFSFVHGSVLDEVSVDEVVGASDIVVHLAAAVGVRLIVEEPLHSFRTNIRGAETVLSAAHRYGKKILVVSTSEIYGKNPRIPLSEDADSVLGSPSVARWAYATSKAVDEILAYAYHKERGLPTIVARLFNTVGPRQSPAYGMVIPRLVRQALKGEPLTVYGDGRQTRCFCHVRDTVEALAGLLEHPDAEGDVFNIGSTEEVSIMHLAERIVEKTGGTSEIRLVPYDEAYETGFEDMQRRVPNTTKIRALTGWQPRYRLDEILDETIAEAITEG